jgi:phage terminase large subunit-like protein
METSTQVVVDQLPQIPPQTDEDLEIKKVVAAAVEEKKKRMRENGIRYYVPLSAERGENDSEGFHKSKARIRAIFGGNRSSKTVSGAAEAVWYATGTHPYKSIPTPNFGRVCCTDFTNGIEKVIIPEINRWMPKHMIHHYDVESRTMYLKNGSTIEFMSYDQDVEKFESASRHWIWFDEEPPEDIYKACRMRVMDTRGDIWMTMTPMNGLTWVYDQIYEQAGLNTSIKAWIFDSLKNPYISKEEIEEICKGLSEQDIEARIHGNFVQLSGLIYREYTPDIHFIQAFKIPAHWGRVQAIDPHPRLPTVAVYLSVCPKQQFIMEARKNGVKLPDWIGSEELPFQDIYCVYDEIYPEDPLIIKDTASLMHTKEGNDTIGYRLIDNSANESDIKTGTTIRQEFEKYGIRTTLANKSDVANRILRVRERLQTRTLFIFRSCLRTEWELRHYAWDDFKIGKDYKDPKEKPRKKRDHAMDCLGYICVSNPKYDAPELYVPTRKTIDPDTGY